MSKDCIYPDQHRLCHLLAKAGVPSHPKWHSLILYMRSLEYNDTLSDAQKAAIHELFLELVKRRDFSDAAYAEVSRRQEEIVTSPYREKLKAALQESTTLLEEFGSVIRRRSGEVQDLGEETVQTVQSGMPPDRMVERLRDSFRRVVSAMDEDAHTLRRLAHTDALTGLANRRALDERLAELCPDTCGDTVSLLMLDIDFFKRINDTYGHQIGDQALRIIAELIRKGTASRCGDGCLPVRYGGEEFVVMAPGLDRKEALDLAEHIRRSVEKYRFEVKSIDGEVLAKDLRMTISVGVAEILPSWADHHAERLVQAADSALYEAKRNGRNQVRIHGAS
ncbi:diguanylate cyclase (GGDEF)-like protein [Desulfobaculum xiamenense]|uniref:diguanylate cyclase n=1 Tax=Desulfobaculum xiamenense TaxID=995050 RepID=A0A846QR10_9BACT|nr:diguanylate cyclase (GGDEF)-like protein [Desulfobaculum xiamenense]